MTSPRIAPPAAQPRVPDSVLAAALCRGTTALGQTLSGDQVGRMIAYLRLLAKWNRVYNLTAVREPERMVTHHLLDSLAIVPYVRGPRVLDVGSGAGLPGLPLAIALPGQHFTLLDANLKKSRFLTQAVLELGLQNVAVVSERVECYRPTHGYATVVSRAFAALAEMLRLCGHLSAPGGRFLAMKGVRPDAELGALPPGYRVVEIAALQVPGVAAPRHVVSIATTELGT
jgi:16S rRNA (guanine527-N7)-methyltransferase